MTAKATARFGGATWARAFMPDRPGAFRLFLALLVFAHHCSRLGLGKYAVYVFFVLSGFWVDRMWMARYRHARRPYLTYLLSRAWRLMPTFALVGMVVVALSLLLGVEWRTIAQGRLVHVAFSSLFIFGYSWLDYLPVAPAWSLDIEVQYYLLAPLLAVLVRRNRLVVAAGLTVVSLAGALTMTRPVLPSYLAFFGAGLLASAADWRPNRALATVSAGLVVLGLIALALSPWAGALLGGANPTPLFAWNPLLNIVAAVATIPFAIYTTAQPSGRTDRMQADLSYIIYLAHWPVFVWLSAVGGSIANRLPYLLAGWVLVLSGSYIVWRWFDRPVNAARARWVARRTGEAGATQEPAAL
ncbi:acyltransferase [Sphingomonas sp.]|jgi:peptidoglycan/LPS O-acetylase OafA/YrhL|uniref:acyltransferase family protein n=1 Tax=Sphingomonas sp. TaxID=28214 RepID=UPI002D7FAF3B|nr:acyltransferase [Sphingomonas sp.]HEU0044766.1 acyltransferase [Sphingomonas sp.]